MIIINIVISMIVIDIVVVVIVIVIVVIVSCTDRYCPHNFSFVSVFGNPDMGQRPVVNAVD